MTEKRQGRPPKKPSDLKDRPVLLKLSATDLATIDAAREASGVSTRAEYIRTRVLDAAKREARKREP